MKSGFVTIIGRPNVGKSTLLNKILGSKVVIASDKAQTTRNVIQGIYTTDSMQAIFLDTPGIHKPVNELGKLLTENAYNSLKGVDAIIFMTSAVDGLGVGDKMILDKISNRKIPKFLLINKIDLLKNKSDIVKVIDEYTKEYEFDEVFPVSAKEGINIDKLLSSVQNALPEGPKYYPDDMITDHPERFIIAEFIREKVLYFTHDEVPHSIAVMIDSLKENEEGIMECYASIIVERDSQKGIIIGKNGELISKVKRLAKRDIENLIGCKVELTLWVKVKKDWRSKKSDLQSFGYIKDNY